MTQNITAAVRAALAPHYAARAEARAQLQKAAEALETARRIEHEAQQELATARSVEDDIMTAHAGKLERAISGGSHTMPPSLVIDTRARQAAATRLGIARMAMEALVAQHTQRQVELTAADAAVTDAENRIIAARLLGMGAEAARHIDAALSIADELHDLVMGMEIYEKPGTAQSLPLLEIQQLLHRLQPLGDDLRTPVDRLRGVAAPRTPWAERRAALLAGDEAITSDAAAA